MQAELTPGHHYFIKRTERTDAFAHKRYTNPGVEKFRSVVLRGKLVGTHKGEVKLHLTGNGTFAREGETYVFSKGEMLVAEGGELRCEELHGAPPNVELGVWG